MPISRKKIIMIFMVFCHMFFLFPQARSTEKQTDSRESIQESSGRMLLFDLKPVNCSVNDAREINTMLRRVIGGIPNVTLVSSEEIHRIVPEGQKGTACHERICALRYGKLLGAGKAIIGSITREMRGTKKLLGDEGEYKYIYEKMKDEYFVIRIELIDITEDAGLAVFEKRARRKAINRTLEALAASLAEYFKPIQPKPVEPEIKKPEPIKQEPAKPEGKKIDEKPSIRPWMSCALSCIVPIARFSKIIGAAQGVTLDLGLANLFFSGACARLSGGYYFLSQKKGDISGFRSAHIIFMAGYSFSLPKGFALAPLIGAGCQFHYIKDYEYVIPYIGPKVSRRYFDPLITIRCEGSYNVHKDLHITFTPGYSLFFERGAMGHYTNIDVGVKYGF